MVLINTARGPVVDIDAGRGGADAAYAEHPKRADRKPLPERVVCRAPVGSEIGA